MLAEWDFDKCTNSSAKKHLNQNVKHNMKEGGRAGKALVINTESLIGTVQVLNVAGGAAKAAQVMNVTTVMAKDSMELKKVKDQTSRQRSARFARSCWTDSWSSSASRSSCRRLWTGSRWR